MQDQNNKAFLKFYIDSMFQYHDNGQRPDDMVINNITSVQVLGSHPIDEHIYAYADTLGKDPLSIYINNAQIIDQIRSHHNINEQIISRIAEIKAKYNISWSLTKNLESMEVVF